MFSKLLISFLHVQLPPSASNGIRKRTFSLNCMKRCFVLDIQMGSKMPV